MPPDTMHSIYMYCKCLHRYPSAAGGGGSAECEFERRRVRALRGLFSFFFITLKPRVE